MIGKRFELIMNELIFDIVYVKNCNNLMILCGKVFERK
jgi:hypothetical protein